MFFFVLFTIQLFINAKNDNDKDSNNSNWTNNWVLYDSLQPGTHVCSNNKKSAKIRRRVPASHTCNLTLNLAGSC
jgi:hypothetical protein